MSYTIRLKSLYNLLGADEGASRKKIDRLYKQTHAKFLCEKMDVNEFILIERAYQEILDYLSGVEERKNDERDNQKKMLLYYTEKAERELKEREKLEAYKGKVYLFLEDLKSEEIEMTIDQYIDYIKTGVLANLDDEAKKLYNEFLCLFLKLWSSLYQHILKVEMNILKRDDFSGRTAVSFGEDELTNEYYNRNRYCQPYGKFSNLLELSNKLSKLIPDEEDNYFLDIHLALMAKYFMFGYGVSKYNNIPIYSFIVNTRLEDFKREYFEMFDEERRRGIRKSPIVDNKELLEFIDKRLHEFNNEKGYLLQKKG